MQIADLAGFMVGRSDQERWRLVAEFLEEYRHENPVKQLTLLTKYPAGTGDEKWDVFLAALAEHLASQQDTAPPQWVTARALEQFWFPFNTKSARVDAIVHAPASFRKRGVFISPQELAVA
jgi:hypothetical protein